VSLLVGLHGTLAIVLLSALLFAEEAGVPLPLIPGDVLLITAGILIANDAISPWTFGPAAFLAVLAGAITCYLWCRTLGSKGLAVLAERLHVTRALDRASSRMQTAGPVTIGVARLIPGLRVYCSMVAGAVGIDLRVFLLGVIPSMVLWVGGGTLIGVLVGVPAVHALSHAQHLALNGCLLVVMGAGTYLALRHMPAAERGNNAMRQAPPPWRLGLALTIDGAIIASIASGVAELARDGLDLGDPNGFMDLAVVFAAIALSYIALARRGAGATAGEGLLAVTYRRWSPGKNPPDVRSKPAGYDHRRSQGDYTLPYDAEERNQPDAEGH